MKQKLKIIDYSRIIALLCFAGALGITACAKSSGASEPPAIPADTTAGKDPAIFPVAYFSDAVKVKAGQPSAGIMQELIQLADRTPKGAEIYMNIYQIDYQPLITALLEADKRGVILHLMIDSSKESSLKKNGPAIESFRKIIRAPGELVVIDNDNGVNAINHHKHMLFSKVNLDGTVADHIVFTTSENFTNRELTVLEDAVVFSDADLYSAFVDNWQQMKSLARSGMKNFEFEQYRFHDGLEQALFFPARNAGSWNGRYPVSAFLDSLDGAYEKDTILVGIDQWSDGQLAIFDKLMALRDKGAHIEIIIRNENSTGLGTKLLKRLHQFSDAGGNVLILPGDQIIHSKYMLVSGVVRGRDRKIVLAGTLNYTNPATQHNNNLLLKLEDPGIFASYRANFEHIQQTYKN